MRFQVHVALLPMPGMTMILAAGLAAGRPVEAAVAGGAALSIGMGATQHMGDRRWDAMLLTGLGMVAATAVGTLAGGDPITELPAAAIIAAAFGAAGVRSGDRWWAWYSLWSPS